MRHLDPDRVARETLRRLKVEPTPEHMEQVRHSFAYRCEALRQEKSHCTYLLEVAVRDLIHRFLGGS